MTQPLSVQQIRKLLKQYHPDQCHDEALHGKYAEVTIRLIQMLKDMKQGGNHVLITNSGKKDGVNAEESDFNLYQLGIQAFQRIHPSRLYRNSVDGRQTLLERREQVAILKDIKKAVAEALFYFDELVHVFPASVWVVDSQEKIHLIKKLEKRYQAFDFVDRASTVDIRTFMTANGIEFL